MFVAALSAFALFASACGDDDWIAKENEALLKPPSEILIQNVVVYDTDFQGCAWDGPTCTPLFNTGMELPDPYAIAYLEYNDGAEDGPIFSNTCQDTLTCTFKGFGFSLRDPLEESWNAVKALHISVYDKDTADDDLIGKFMLPKSTLNAVYQDSKNKGYSTIEGTLDTRIVSMRISIK